MKKLIKQLIFKIIIVCIALALINCLIYLSSPNIQEEDIYPVSSKCVKISKVSVKHGSIKYIHMDDGEKFRIPDSMIDYVDGGLYKLENNNISFYASEKSLFWDGLPEVVAWSHMKHETLKKTNQENFSMRLTLGITSVIIGSLFIIPQILRISAYRDAQKEKQWHIQKKETRHKKIIDKNLPPLEEQKTKPKNISKKKWERRKKL